jgi:hypothetical protein
MSDHTRALKLAKEIAACNQADTETGFVQVAKALIERLTPVTIKLSAGFKSFACQCGSYPDDRANFCPHCGVPLAWK